MASPVLGPEAGGVFRGFLSEHGIAGVSIASLGGAADTGYIGAADLCVGLAQREPPRPMRPETWLEVASLSKTIAAAFAHEYFASRGVAMTTSVNELLAQAGVDFRLEAAEGCPREWAEEVQLTHLIDHTGLGMHYVYGVPRADAMPSAGSLIRGERQADLGYERIRVYKKPGVAFGYSGGGFLVLQTLVEAREGEPIEEVMRPFLDACGMRDFSFAHEDLPGVEYADGYFDDGTRVPGGRLMFPALAAGGLGSPRALANFWRHLFLAYERPVPGPISHETAVAMLTAGEDKGSGDFMNARMGRGVFIADAGPNRIGLHQAANEGFRGMYMVCFKGPDAGNGYIVSANGDNQAAVCIAKIVQHLLIESRWRGIDHELLRSRQAFDFTGIKQEEIVNFAFKTLVFDAFRPAVEPTPKL